MKQSFFHFNVTLTWSKIMALVILVDVSWLDHAAGLNGTLFMYALPFVAAMIMGKQGLDAVKEIKTKLNSDNA